MPFCQPDTGRGNKGPSTVLLLCPCEMYAVQSCLELPPSNSIRCSPGTIGKVRILIRDSHKSYNQATKCGVVEGYRLLANAEDLC